MKYEKCWCDICGNEIICDNIFSSSDWMRFDILTLMHFTLNAFKMFKGMDESFLIQTNKYHVCEKCKKIIAPIEHKLEKEYNDKIDFINKVLIDKAYRLMKDFINSKVEVNYD